MTEESGLGQPSGQGIRKVHSGREDAEFIYEHDEFEIFWTSCHL